MHDQRRTKAQLYTELAALRARVAELEQTRFAVPRAGEPIDQRAQHDSSDVRERQRVEHVLEWQGRFFRL